MKKFLVNNIPFLGTLFLSLLMLAVSFKVTMFRYKNYEYGKFDLGNMSQMVYNTSRGNFMEVTDYFGANMPRWGMSHVDPFLIIFVPIYYFFADARVLIVGQLLLVIFSSLVIYLISNRILKSKIASFFISSAYLFYPAVGYLLAWTGFHGVTAVIPFFLLSFLFYELLEEKGISKKLLITFYFFVFLTLMGKEEISLIYFMYGLYLTVFRKFKWVGLSLIIVGLLWFSFSFFVLIPSAAKYRVEGYKKFAESVDLKVEPTKDVLKGNYFLGRYGKFGDSYFEILKNVLTNPKLVIKESFSGDKKENLQMTLSPLLFLPIFYTPVFMISFPEFFINYLTTSAGIGTAEIYNHRVSMIIPILFISLIFGFKFFKTLLDRFSKFKTLNSEVFYIFCSILIFASSVYFSNLYQNPILLWFTQSLGRKLAFAQEATNINNAPVLGSREKINRLETKDRVCFDDATSLIPKDASVSAPDYLGDHLSARKSNALFPSNFNTADYVLVDVFSKKVTTILGVDSSLLNHVVGKLVKNGNYSLIYSCSNLFVFKKAPNTDSLNEKPLPLQEYFSFEGPVDFNLMPGLSIVSVEMPKEVTKGNNFNLKTVYKKLENTSINSFILYTSFKHIDSGKLYQIANLPSFGIKPLSEWSEGNYYEENNSFVLPQKLPIGKYNVFIGATNNLKTYNIYVGNIILK